MAKPKTTKTEKKTKTAATEKKPPKARTGKQTAIPGATPAVFEDIEKAALAFTDIRDERMGLADPEAAAKAKLGEAMKRHGLSHYTMLDGRVVTYGEKVDVHVRTPKDKGVVDA